MISFTVGEIKWNRWKLNPACNVWNLSYFNNNSFIYYSIILKIEISNKIKELMV